MIHSAESLSSSWSAAWFSFLSPASLLQNAALPSESWEHRDTKLTVAALSLQIVYVTGIVTVNSQGRGYDSKSPLQPFDLGESESAAVLPTLWEMAWTE